MAKEKDPNIDAIRDFIKDVKKKHTRGNAGELTYRSELERLISDIGGSKIDPINEAKTTTGNAVDITIERNGIAIGHLEAKDINVDINDLKRTNKDQFDRYIKEFDNLIYTNNLDWNFYRDGDLVRSVSIATLTASKITPITENYVELVIYLQDFLDQRPETIKTAEALTSHMARRTEMIRFSILKSMTGDDPLESLISQRNLIDKMLVKDITIPEFADMYAQTITYGLFIAKLYSDANNKPAETFIRQNIPDLLPTTYPFLSKLFSFIATEKLKDKLDQPIDDLINLYRAAPVQEIMATYKRGSGREDPFIHFYEDFLTAYNPEERERSGVYYTPEPVVDFIVRGVDWVLKNKFDLRDGLAHSKKIFGKKYPKPPHKVQILDPATGTGTFLAQTIRHIAQIKQKTGSAGWSSYVDNDLLPRLHGFEHMMAPYVMSYLKLDMVLAELGYTSPKPPKKNPDRMSIYLTNSLAGTNKDTEGLPFVEWLADESKGAANIKDNQPIMCVIGNPPYLGESNNKDTWIMDLMEAYKKEPDSSERLQERNPKWLNNDYVKFIRMAQHMVDKNGEGVVGMITDHSYLDNATFRGMRWHLMNSFDGIYILDLHGNSRKREIAPNGDLDKNVFDIMQGVSIIIAWKTKQAKKAKKPLAQVFHGDLLGGRAAKFKTLQSENLDSNLFQKLEPCAPDYFLLKKNYDKLEEYQTGFEITKLFHTPAGTSQEEADIESQKGNTKKHRKTNDYSVGIITGGDSFVIAENEEKLRHRLDDFLKTDKSESDIQEYYGLGKNYAKRLFNNKAKLKINDDNFIPIAYRPFDSKIIYYDNLLIERLREKIMCNFLKPGNLGLIVGRQGQVVGSMPWNLIFIQDQISDINIFYRGGGTVFPLYTYPDTAKNLDTNGHSRRVNMDEDLRKEIEDVATDSKHKKPDEKQIFDYIYGILHTPQYRERYAEFLKTNFPRIPYPKTPAEFWHLSSIGTKLREMHLKPDSLDISAYTFDGDDTTPIVERPLFNNGKVWINDSQYFANVPESAWNFYIGGYQPARKWLKDRKGQTLEHKDILHYQRIIAVLVQTEQTMKTIKWSRP